MKKVLFITKKQFGYHIGAYKYCQYLKKDYDITYYCFDYGAFKNKMDNVKVVYVPSTGNLFSRAYRFVKNTKNVSQKKWDIVFIMDFDFCFLVKYFMKGHSFILDIRTASVSPKFIKRNITNIKIRLNTLFFKNISIVSNGVAEFFNIKKFLLLPLGADVISDKPKAFKNLNLVYVGTLHNRNISETIKGIYLFLNKNVNANLTYDIFGMGDKEEVSKIKNNIRKYKLDNFVKFHGWRSHTDLVEYFDKCNIGVSYIPLRNYYNFQPPTKTFEYVFSGMVCLATRTKANDEIICSENGVLCYDSPESFSESLEIVNDNLHKYKSEIINKTLKDFSWENITINILKPYFEKL